MLDDHDVQKFMTWSLLLDSATYGDVTAEQQKFDQEFKQYQDQLDKKKEEWVEIFVKLIWSLICILFYFLSSQVSQRASRRQEGEGWRRLVWGGADSRTPPNLSRPIWTAGTGANVEQEVGRDCRPTRDNDFARQFIPRTGSDWSYSSRSERRRNFWGNFVIKISVKPFIVFSVNFLLKIRKLIIYFVITGQIPMQPPAVGGGGMARHEVDNMLAASRELLTSTRDIK